MIFAESSMWDWVLGKDPSRTGTPEFQWGNMPESWGVFILIGIVVASVFLVFWLYRREISTCPPGIKILLAGLRCFVVLLVVFLCLKPQIVFKKTRVIKPSIGFARDASTSIARKDKYNDEKIVDEITKVTGFSADNLKAGAFSRSEILEKALQQKSGDLVRQLREKGSIRILDFAEFVKPAATIPALGETKTASDEKTSQESNADSGDKNDSVKVADDKTNGDQETSGNENKLVTAFPLLVADGRASDIFQVLQELLQDTSRLSGIVLATDGQHNGTGTPDEIIDLARKAADLGVPIFVIPMGDPNPPKNVKVDNVDVRTQVSPDEPFEIEALVYTNQLSEQKVRLDLVRYNVAANEELENEQIVESVDLDAPAGGGRLRHTFQHTLADPGKYVFKVVAPPLDNESDTDDNEKPSGFVDVVDAKVKVLLIAGGPTWDYRMVKNLLQRDRGISLSCWLQTMDEDRPQEGNEPISVLPRTFQEIGRYNVVMMFDPRPDEFDEEFMNSLQKFIKRKAGGFLYMAGPMYTAEYLSLNRLKKMEDILPVRFDREMVESTALLIAETASEGKMLPVDFNLDHQVMKFETDPAENKARWAEMPSIYWSFPALAPKPTAKVLLERGDQMNAEGNQPLLVTSRYGAGNVLYLGFNGTWRWRRVGVQAQFFDRFWIQVCRFLVETRSLQGISRGVIDSDRKDYELGQRVTLNATVLDEKFEDSTAPMVKATLKDQNGRTRPLDMQLLPSQPGQYETSFIAQQTGVFEVQIDLGSSEDAGQIAPISFRVDQPRVESSQFWLNENLLRQIATESNGAYLTVDKIAELPDLLPNRETKTEVKTTPQPIWGASEWLRYLLFLLPVVLLTIEWSLRKWFKLL